jgi:TPR repeat protein
LNLGNLYYNGYSGLVKQNYKEAVKWFTKAAEQGNSSAQEMLGDRYYFGEGVAQSNSDALDWYEKAADQGDEDAIFRIKEMANKGDSRATFLIECIYKED